MHANHVLTANGTYYLIKAHHGASLLSNILLDVGITTESDKMLFEHFLLFQHITVLLAFSHQSSGLLGRCMGDFLVVQSAALEARHPGFKTRLCHQLASDFGLVT